MNRLLIACAAAFTFAGSLSAIPPGTGSQHIRFTGYEEIIAPPGPPDAEGWMTLTTRVTMSIPSLKVTGLKLDFVYLYKEVPEPDGTFHMYGSGLILNDAGGVIGAASFMNTGRYVSGPPVVEWFTDGTVVGTIWAGPYAGMVLTANGDIHAKLDFTKPPQDQLVLYDSLFDGFLIVSDNVDPDSLKALKAH